MKILFTGVCLLLATVLFVSFKNDKKISKSDIAGFWVDENASAPGVSYCMKVFDKEGDFYNLGYENGQTIMTHKGKYKILDKSHYKEEVTALRFEAKWDLRNKEFINNYELSSDKKWLLLSGIVFNKDGSDSLKWSHKYRRVEMP